MENSAHNDILQITNFANLVTGAAFVIDLENKPIYSNSEFDKKFKIANHIELLDKVKILNDNVYNQVNVTINIRNYKCYKIGFIVNKKSYYL
ncbi:MAG: hypothetical protein JXR36_17145, partial [Bacteroidales bacterium]|nr:hypothetical protein [Bacteroidales bacterium]